MAQESAIYCSLIQPQSNSEDSEYWPDVWDNCIHDVLRLSHIVSHINLPDWNRMSESPKQVHVEGW